MSWEVTEHEGRVCYEQDGRRVFSTQEVNAINKLNSSSNNNSHQWTQHNYYEEMLMEGEDSINFSGKPSWISIIIIILLIAWAIISCFR